MEIKFFSDLIDALGKAISGIKSLANIPKKEREKYRQVMDETYRLIDTTLNMVIIRLGDILLKKNDSDSADEIMLLDNWQEWYDAERGFRLCQNLRAAYRETETLRNNLTGSMSVAE